MKHSHTDLTEEQSMTILHAIDGSGRCVVLAEFGEGDALTIRSMPDALFGPKPKRCKTRGGLGGRGAR